MAKSGPNVTVDPLTGACYISLSGEPIKQTIQFSDAIYVDLNAMSVAVGVEVIDMSVKLPLTDLVRRIHFLEKDKTFLGELLPTLKYSLRITMQSAPDPSISARVGVVN